MKIYKLDYKKDAVYAHCVTSKKWIFDRKISDCTKQQLNYMKNADSNDDLSQDE